MAKYTDRKNLLDCYRSRQQESQKLRENKGFDQDWTRFIELYKGRDPHCDSAEAMVTNLVYPTVNIMLSSALISNPRITINPRNQDSYLAAAITERALNRDWEREHIQKAIKRATKDRILVGHGWVKVGYRLSETSEIKDGEDPEEALDRLAEEARKFYARGATIGRGLPSRAEMRTMLEARGRVVLDDAITAVRVSPFDMFVDLHATVFEDVRWLCQRARVPLLAAKDKKEWNREAREALTADTASTAMPVSIGDSIPISGGVMTQDEDAQWCYVYEFYDLVDGTMCTFGEHGDKFLVDPKPMPFPFGHPFVFIAGQEVPESFYPMGEVEAIESAQAELNDIRTSMYRERKDRVVKWIAKNDVLTDDVKLGLETRRHNLVVPVDGDGPLEEFIKPILPPPVNNDLYQQSQLVQQDIYSITGVSEYQRGGVQAGATATEAAMIGDAVKSRFSEMLAAVERAMVEVAEREVMLMQQYMVLPRMLRVAGAAVGKTWYVPYDREAVQGDFDFEIEAGSTKPLNDTQRRQQAQQIMAVAGPFIGQIIDPKELLRYVLSEGFQVTSPERLFIGHMPDDQDPFMGEPTGQPAGVPSAPGSGALQPGGGEPPEQGLAPAPQMTGPPS